MSSSKKKTQQKKKPNMFLYVLLVFRIITIVITLCYSNA